MKATMPKMPTSHYRALSDLQSGLGDPLFTADDLRAYAAHVWRLAMEQAAAVVEPTAPRGCDCERCCCGNQGDAEWVYAWDIQHRLAERIRSLPIPEVSP